MFESLFGAEMPLAVRFFLAFLIVLALIGATAWAVRRFGSGRLGTNTRGRQPRLAVIDYASVDGRRRLILVRRDNVEHLLMIGGPTDVVVEPNIVRAVAAPRDVASGRPAAGIEALPRAIPLPENGSNGSWPLQPEPAGGSRPSPRLEPLADELPLRPFPSLNEMPARPQRDTLTALADELSTRPTLPRTRPLARPQPDELSQEIRQESRQDHQDEHRQEALEARVEPRAEPRPEPRKPQEGRTLPPAPVSAGPVAAAPASTAADDQTLAEMAQRLEAALRKPGASADASPPPTPARAAPAARTDAIPPVPPRAPRPNEPKAAPRTEDKTNQSKTLYDSLEQEMASLLGRQNKT
jgi:flagellar protein FliO/FliZ